MSKNPLYKIIEFPLRDTGNGALVMFQKGDVSPDLVPFEIKKVLTMVGMRGEDKRGAHTHYKTQQLLITLTGECKVDLDNGQQKETVTLNKPNQALLLYPYVWHVMHSFKPDTTLLVLADNLYDEKDYIRNYEDFIQQLPKRI